MRDPQLSGLEKTMYMFCEFYSILLYFSVDGLPCKKIIIIKKNRPKYITNFKETSLYVCVCVERNNKNNANNMYIQCIVIIEI